MSVKIMGAVWDSCLPRPEKFVLLAFADHADHDGGNVYPSFDLIARKTGYDRRQIIRIVNSLEKLGIMVPRGRSRLGTNLWWINIAKLPKPKYTDESVESEPEGGDILTPQEATASDKMSPQEEKAVTFCHPESDILTPGVTFSTGGGDIFAEKTLKMSPEPSLTVIKPSIEPSVEPCDSLPGNHGWLFKVLDKTSYSPDRAWKATLEHMRFEMPKDPYDTHVLGTVAADFDPNAGLLTVVAKSEYSAEWLKSRMKSTCERVLAGMLNRSVDVRFIPPNMSPGSGYATL